MFKTFVSLLSGHVSYIQYDLCINTVTEDLILPVAQISHY